MWLRWKKQTRAGSCAMRLMEPKQTIRISSLTGAMATTVFFTVFAFGSTRVLVDAKSGLSIQFVGMICF